MVEAVVHSMTRSPTRLDVVMWVPNMMEQMRGEGGFIRNAWKKMGDEWFADKKE